uniref:Uncharacterized protein n=1 Tax=Anguilla anguilla TaxID=7936 RepID=A0A0E9XUS2_ANGAN
MHYTINCKQLMSTFISKIHLLAIQKQTKS